MFGAAVELDGQGDFVELQHLADNKPEAGTFTAWFNSDDLGGRQSIVSTDSKNLDDGGHFTVQVIDNEIYARIQSDSASYEIRGGSVDEGVWNNVAVSFGPEGFSLYLNGEQVGETVDYGGGLQGNENPWTFGAGQRVSGDNTSDGATDFFNGKIDDVALFEGQLSPEEIGALADASVQDFVDSQTPGAELGSLTYPLTISADDLGLAAGDTVTISGLPEGVTLSAGVDNGEGGFTVTIAELDGLTLTAPSGADLSSISATATVMQQEIAGADTVYGGLGDDVIYGDNGDGTGTGTTETTVTEVTETVTLLTAGFGSGTEGFVFEDGVFGTDTDDYSSGAADDDDASSADDDDTSVADDDDGGFDDDGDEDDGSLSITLGGQDNDNIGPMSGGWTTSVSLDQDHQNASLTFSYRMEYPGDAEPDEGAEVRVFVDGQPFGLNGEDYIIRLTGEGNDDVDTGWQTVTLDLGSLPAGSHEITLGGWFDGKTTTSEEVQISFDDVSLTGERTIEVVEEGPVLGDTLYGGDGNDEIYGEIGNDEVYGGAGDDIVSGGIGSDWIIGGTDSGGSASFTETLDVTLVGSEAGYNNSLGYYTIAEDGTPEAGEIIWANINATNDGSVHQIVLDGIDADDVGFFIIPDGADQNQGLADGAIVTFVQDDDGNWVAEIDGQELQGLDAPAYFSTDADLNKDGMDHIQHSVVTDGTSSGVTDAVGAAMLALDPVSYWRFGENSGHTAADETGLNDGAYENGVGLGQPGAFGDDADGSAYFGGSDDFVDIPHNDAYNLESGTITLSVKPQEVNGTQGLFSKSFGGDDDDDTGRVSLYLDGGRLVAQIESGDQTYTLETANDAIQANEWANIAFTFGAEGAKLFLDGAEVDTSSYTGGIGATGPDTDQDDDQDDDAGGSGIIIGATGSFGSDGDDDGDDDDIDTADHFKGWIDEVAIFDKQLDEVDLGLIYEPSPLESLASGSTVQIGFEDLYQGGDMDFDDAVIQVEHSIVVDSFTAGDQIWGGDVGGTGDGEKDVFVFNQGDGYDTIHDFEAGVDQLLIGGYGKDDVEFVADGDDTIIKLGETDAIKLSGVSVDDLGGTGGVAELDADQNDDGVLGVDELVSLKDDLFDEDDTGPAPEADEASIVFIAPIEPGVIDDGNSNS